MKIVIDARLYGLENAGLGRYVMNLVDELKKHDGKNHYTILLREKYFNELSFPGDWKKVLAEYQHYSLGEQLVLPWILYKEKPDLVHFPHFNVPLLYFGRFVVTIHDLLMHKFTKNETTTLPFPLFFFKRVGYKLSFFKAVRSSRAIVTPSKAVKDDIVTEYRVPGSKISVTYEGVDKKFTQYSKQARKVLDKYNIDGSYLIYAGNAYPHKNLSLAIKAIVNFNKDAEKKLCFVITTSRGVFLDRLKKEIGNLGAQGFVKIIGFVPDEDLGVLYNNALAFIYPSLSEGFGLQGLEVMDSGSLLLASDIPVFREIYDDIPIYFDPRNVESIVEGIGKVVEMNQGKRKQLIKHSQSFVARYSWQKMARETLTVYESSVSPP